MSTVDAATCRKRVPLFLIIAVADTEAQAQGTR